MKVANHIIPLCLLACLFAACEKDETSIVLPPKPADVKMLSVNMGKDYNTQIFVNLASGVSTSVDYHSWDLAFDASASGTAIYQNSGRNILTANSGFTTFQTHPELRYLFWQWDPASGNKDSLALRNITNANGQITDSVYYVNFGPSQTIYQFRITSITTSAYTIEFTDLDNHAHQQITILKDPSKSMVYFSFSNGGQYLNFEPNKDDWHICFLRYRWIYYEFNPPLLYLVSGVFVNQNLVTAVQDSVLDFYAVNKASCVPLNYLNRRDVVGFSWKSPDLSNTSNVKYTIRKDYYYLIKENKNDQRLFKLRFLDFYDAQGIKGTPRFETQQLN